MKLIHHILSLTLLLSFGSAAGQTFVDNGISYATRPDGSVEVTAGEGYYRDAITIPATAGGKTVVALGRAAMNSCHGLRSLTLPETVTTLDDYALNGCDSLTAITLSPALVSIGDHALARCETLKGTLTLPEGLTSVGDFAFFRCRTLIGIDLPASLTDIGSRAFMSCSQLKSITVADGNTAFCDDAGMLLTADRATLVAFPRKHTTWRDCIVPATVQHIADYAFYGCDAMKTIVFPAELQSIGTSALEQCKALKSITLPSSVTSLGANAFKDCNALAEVHCQAAQPPALNPYTTPFGYLTDLTAKTLYVPFGSTAAYSSAPVWSLFGSIIEEAGSAVETVADNPPLISLNGNTVCIDRVAADTAVSVYRLDGTLVDSGKRAFTLNAAGIYIVRVGSEAYKIMIP